MKIVRSLTIILALTLAVTPALAAIQRFKSNLLLNSDAPSSRFGQVHSATYPHFTSQMTVSVISSQGPASQYCYVPSSYADGWQEGLIEAFNQTNPAAERMALCGYLFRSAGQAHRAYLAGSKSIRQAIRSKQVHKLSGTKIGNERVGMRYQPAGFPYVTYELIFRRQNAVIDLSYESWPTYGATSFLRLASRVDRRLR